MRSFRDISPDDDTELMITAHYRPRWEALDHPFGVRLDNRQTRTYRSPSPALGKPYRLPRSSPLPSFGHVQRSRPSITNPSATQIPPPPLSPSDRFLLPAGPTRASTPIQPEPQYDEIPTARLRDSYQVGLRERTTGPCRANHQRWMVELATDSGKGTMRRREERSSSPAVAPRLRLDRAQEEYLFKMWETVSTPLASQTDRC
jgi:hypothetical protein